MPTGRLAQVISVEVGAGSTQKAEFHGGCLSLEGLSGPEPELLAHRSKFTSHLFKNLGLSPGTHPGYMQWRWSELTQPTYIWGTACKDLSCRNTFLALCFGHLPSPGLTWDFFSAFCQVVWGLVMMTCIGQVGFVPHAVSSGSVPLSTALDWPSPVGGCQLCFSSSHQLL